jgi:hypothetical protein
MFNPHSRLVLSRAAQRIENGHLDFMTDYRGPKSMKIATKLGFLLFSVPSSEPGLNSSLGKRPLGIGCMALTSTSLTLVTDQNTVIVVANG